MKTLTNDVLQIAVADHGAELSSLQLVATGREYLWQADAAFWKRHSPVLFPIVGALWEGRFRVGEKSYPMGQHGFARDMDFCLVEETTDTAGNPELLYVLRSSEETLKKFPYRFRLEIGYRLIGRTVEVTWRVMNPSHDEVLPFQIGAHPAFYWPLFSDEDVRASVDHQKEVLAAQSEARGSFILKGKAFDQATSDSVTLTRAVITEGGCVGASRALTVPRDGVLPLTTSTFDDDALIFSDGAVQSVTLAGVDGKPYLTLRSHAPLMGLWSPPHKNAPFVCIEPWYGRTDNVGYTGVFSERPHLNLLDPLAVFEASYQITVE